MAKTKGRYGKSLSLTEHKARIKRAHSNAPSYTNYYYKAYRSSGGKMSLKKVLGK